MTLLSAVLPRLLDCLLHIAAVIDFSLTYREDGAVLNLPASAHHER
jgi:hypothetical protein